MKRASCILLTILLVSAFSTTALSGGPADDWEIDWVKHEARK